VDALDLAFWDAVFDCGFDAVSEHAGPSFCVEKFQVTYIELVAIFDFMTFLSLSSFVTFMTSPEEFHGIELVQSLFLMIAAYFFARSGVHYRDNPITSIPYYGLALLMWSCFLRETPVAKIGPSPVWSMASFVLRGSAVLLWLYWFRVTMPHMRVFFAHCWQLLKLPAIRVTMLGTLLYLASWPLDKGLLSIDVQTLELTEELVELLATGVFLLGSLPRFRNATLPHSEVEVPQSA
jgi:hypothetical protein